MALTSTSVTNAKPREKQYRLTDGQGMYLLIMPSGKKYWRLDYILHGKRKTFAIGTCPEISLKKARESRRDAKALIADNIDPVQFRKASKGHKAQAAANTFEAVSNEWFALQYQAWTAGHSCTVKSRLKRDIIPWLGSRPIKEITAPEILTVLRRIESRGAGETAHRCKTIVSQVFRYGIATGAAERDRAADLRVRPGELRHAEWAEIGWIKKEWQIPAAKMKMRRDHTIPLSNQSLDVLREIHPLTGQGKYVFPSLRTDVRPMSNNTVLGALRRMGFTKEEMTPHGFRSMASTLLHENGFSHEIIELQLAHSRRDRVAAAYDRSRRLPERREMMQAWANYLDELEHADTVSLEAATHG